MMVDRNLPQELTDLDSFLDVLAAKVADRIAPSQPHPGWTEPFPLEWSLEANGGGTLTSGAVRLTYFTAKKSETVGTMRVATSTASTGTATLSKVGLYAVDSSADLTLLSGCTSNTTLFNAAVRDTTLTSSVSLVEGNTYASALLYVGANIPTIHGARTTAGIVFPGQQRLNGSVNSQSDLPGSIAAGSVSNTGFRAWFALGA